MSVTKNGDSWVEKVQIWYNTEYSDRSEFVSITVDGVAGTETCTALIRALQMELNISSPDGIFGNQTIATYEQNMINEDSSENLVRILQGGFICKGIGCGDFDGVFGDMVKAAITVFRGYTGMNGEAVMDARHMKALLNTDPFILSGKGERYILDIQRYLNLNYSDYYWKKIGLIPCNGIPERNMVKAIVYALQYEEAKVAAAGGTIDISGVDGVVGTNTLNNAPVLSMGSDKVAFVKILQMTLGCMYGTDAGLDGVFDSEVESTVKGFQAFMCLNQDSTVALGTVDRKTWASLLISKGDTSRYANACDCAAILDEFKAKTLKNEGYDYVGRYLTGTYKVSSTETASKALTLEEIKIISDAGLKIFAIYQAGGASADYFSLEKGYSDAEKAYDAAKNLKIPLDEIIYFAVDYDFIDKQVTNIVIPHFQGINNYFAENGIKYRIGIYGSRNICSRVSEAGLAISSFVADMSTGYSGNMGYPMPSNWAFDQIKEYTIAYSGGSFNVDKDVASGRYTGFDINTYCGGDNYRDATKHDMVLQDDGHYLCSVCGYRVKSPGLQDDGILSYFDRLNMQAAIWLFNYYCLLETEGIGYSNFDIPSMLLHAMKEVRASYVNKYEYADGQGICLIDNFVYPHNSAKLYMEFPLATGEVGAVEASTIYNPTVKAFGNLALCIFSPHYEKLSDIQALIEALEGVEEFGEYSLQKFVENMAKQVTKQIGDEVFEHLFTLINLGIEVSEEPEYEIEEGDYIVEYPVILDSAFYAKNTCVVFDSEGKCKYIILNDYHNK